MAPSSRAQSTVTRPTVAVALAVALVGALIFTMLRPVPASATLPGVDPDAHPPYGCDGTAFLMLNGTYSTVTPDPANPGNWIVSALPATTTIGNSLGYDPVTNYVYGTRNVGGITRVETYDANGGLVSTADLQAPFPQGASVYSGTVLGDGTYIIGSWGKNNAASVGWYNGDRFNLWSVEAQTGVVSHIGSVPRSEADFSYNPLDGYLYHASSGYVTKWDPITGAETRIDVPDWDLTGFGGSWFDDAGNLYVYKNKNGEMWQIADPGGSPSASLVGSATSASGVDATSCIGSVDLLKDVVDDAGTPIPLEDRSVRPGDVVTYAFTLINNAIPTGAQPLTVCDSFSDGRTFTGDFNDPTGTVSFDSPLTDGDTAMCMTVNVPSSLWTDPYTPGGSPVTVSIDVAIPDDFVPGEYENQAWIDTDGDRTTAEVRSDDPGDLSDGEDPTTVNVTGTLQVAKEVAGHPTDDDTDDFAFTLTCTNPDGSAHDVAAASIVAAGTNTPWSGAGTNSFTLSNGQAVDIWDLPAGTVCATSETPGPYYPIATSNDGGTTENSATTKSEIDGAPGTEQAAFQNYTSTFTIDKITKLPKSDYDLNPVGDFEVVVECKRPDGTTYSATHTVTADTAIGTPPTGAGGNTVTPPVPLLPHQSSCTVTETASNGWELADSNGTEFTTSVKEQQAVEFTNVMVLADLTVTKEIVGLPEGADPGDFSFDITIACEGDAFATDPSVIETSITPGDPFIVKGLPVGATCTVAETPDAAFFTTYSSKGGEVEIESGGSKLQITNTTGILIIKKNTVVDSTHPIDPNGSFTFDIDCVNDGSEVYSGTHTLATDTPTDDGAMGGIGYDELPLLPPGTVCKIGERDPGSDWTPVPNGDPVTITVDPDAPQTAEFINQRTTSNLTIDKVIVGAPDSLDLSDERFDVTVTCSGDFESAGGNHIISDLTVGETGDLVVEDLPTGATCQVLEAADERFATSYTPENGKVDLDADGAEVEITNSTSWFELVKNTTGKGADPLALDGTFTFAVSCEGPTGASLYDEKVTLTTSSQTGSLDPTTDPALPLLPPGSVCVVEEDVPTGWELTSDNPQKIETTTDGNSLSFENSRQVADLTISKTIEGLPADLDPGDYTFELTVSCSGGFATSPYVVTDLAITAGTDVVVTGLPVGATCSVTETADRDFTAGYSATSTRIGPAGASVTVTNSTGLFSIRKTAIGADSNGLDLGQTFTFDVSCTRPDGSTYEAAHSITTATGSGGISSSTTATPAIPIFPPSTMCDVSEQTPPSGWSLATAETVRVEVGSAELGEAAFVNRRETGDLTITKTLLGVPAGEDWDDDEFAIDVICDGDFASSPLTVNNLIVTANAPATITDLPTGAVCTFTEDADARFTPTYAPANDDGSAGEVTIVSGGVDVDIVNATGEIIVAKYASVGTDHPIEWNDTFEFAIVCESPAGATIYDEIHTLSTDTAGAGGGIGSIGYGDLPSLPTGTACMITEQNLPTGWSLQSANNVEVTITTARPQTASFTNSRDIGDLTVIKEIRGLPADQNPDDYQFVADVSCTGPFTSSPYLIEDQTITTASDLVIGGLPTGAVCAVVEDADSRFASSYDPADGDGDGDGAELTVGSGDNTVTVTNSTGTLGITKSATHAGDQSIDLVDTFTFAVVCDTGLSSTYTVTTDGSGEGSTVIPALPLLATGTLCTVTEQAPPTGWSIQGEPSIEITIPTGGATATFTNVRSTGDLTITKSLFGIPVGENLDNERFIVDVTCVGDFSDSPLELADQTISVTTPLVIEDLPTGAVCTVIEQADERFDSSYSATSATVVDDGARLGVINTTGELIVEKFAEVDSAHPIDVAATFEFSIVCSNPAGSEIYNQTHQLTTAATSATTSFGAIGYNELPLLPDGTDCTVTETDLPTGWTLQSENELDLTIDADTTATATFSNERQTGDLLVTKTLAGLPESLDLSTASFDVTISCTGDLITTPDGSPYVITNTVSAQTDLLITDLPTGAACTVVEDPGALFSVSADPIDATVTIGNDPARVDLTNSTGELVISKSTVAATTHPIDPTGTFSFSIECNNGPTPYVDEVDIVVDTLTATGAWGGLRFDQLPLLPAGTTCTVAETAVPDGWTLSSEESVELTISSDGPETAAFTNTRDTTSVTVTKVLEGVPDEIDLDDEAFEMTLSCTGDFVTDEDEPYETTVMVSVNDPVVITDLPTLADCTVSETDDSRFAVAYEQPETLGADGVEAVVTNSTGTFTVTKSTTLADEHPIEDDDTFTYEIVCIDADGSVLYDDEIEIETVEGSGAWGIGDTPLLPPATTCSVVEKGRAGWTIADRTGGETFDDAGMGFIIGDEIVDLAFTNERNVADLTITKTLDGVPAGEDLTLETFGLTVTCVGGFGLDAEGDEISYEVPGPLEFSVAEPLVVTDLPAGSRCEIVEEFDDRFAPSYISDDALGDNGSTVIIAKDGTSVDVTNSTGHLVLIKTTSAASGQPIDLGGEFTFEVECDNGYSAIHVVAVTTPVSDGMVGVIGADDLPLLAAGTTCDVTEVEIPQGWALNGPATINLEVGQGSNQVDFENVRTTGDLRITKALARVPETMNFDSEQFPLTITCDGDFTNGRHVITSAVSADTPTVIEGLPTGASCTVVETPDAILWTVGYAVNGVAGDGSLSIAEETRTLAITNVYSETRSGNGAGVDGDGNPIDPAADDASDPDGNSAVGGRSVDAPDDQSQDGQSQNGQNPADQPQAQTGALAFTGVSTGHLLAIALLLIGVGAALIAATRRPARE